MIFAAVFVLVLLSLLMALVFTKPFGQQEKVSLALQRLEGYNPRVFRLEELSAPAGDRLVKPLGLRLARVASLITPQSRLERLARKVETAGRPWNLDLNGLLAAKLLSLVAGLIGLVVLTSLHLLSTGLLILAGTTAVLFSYYLPDLILNVWMSQRKRLIQRQLPDFLDLLTVTVEAGLGLDSALARIAERMREPLKQEILITLHHMRIGQSREEALRVLAERCGVKDLDTFVAAVIQSSRLGVSLGHVMRLQSEHIRTLRRQRIQEAGQKAPVKLIFPLVFCIFPTLFVVILGPAAIRIYQTFMGMF
jgi:tight adherence protein C